MASTPGPAIVSLQYATSGNVSVSLDVPATQAIGAAIFDGDLTGVPVVSANTTGSTVILAMPTPVPGHSYVAAVTYGTVAQPVWGPPAALVWETPTLVSVVLSDADVGFAWTLPQSATAVVAALADLNQEVALLLERTTATSIRLTPAIALSAAGSYGVVLTGFDGMTGPGQGPSVTLTLPPAIFTPPAVGSLVYRRTSGSAVELVVTPRDAISEGMSLIAQLLGDGRIVASSTTPAAAPAIARSARLDPATRWQVQLLYNQGVITGAPGPAVDVPTQAPQLTALAYDGTNFSIAWLPPSGSPGATGAVLSIKTGNLVVGAYSQAYGNSASFPPTGTIDPTLGYIVSAGPILGAASGLYDAAAPIIVAAPEVGSVIYDGSWVQVALTSAPAAAVATLLTLSTAAGAVAQAEGGLAGGRIQAPVSITGSATLTVQAIDGRGGHGPASAAVPIVALAATIISVTVTGAAPATIAAQVAYPAALPTGGKLVGTLYTDGAAGEHQMLTTRTGTLSWSVTATAGSSYAIDVATVVTANAVTSQGPSSARVSVPLAPPQSVTAAYDGETVTIGVALAPGPAPDGYTVTLTGGGNSMTFVLDSSLPIAFPANLGLSTIWTASVSPRFGVLLGNPGTATVAMPPAPSPPVLTSVVYDGARLSLLWSAAVLPFLTGYKVTIGANPDLVVGAEQTTCTVPLPIAQATGNVTVTALSRLRNTDASPPVAIVSAPVQITALSVGTNVVATWTVSGATTAAQAELLVGDSWVQQIGAASATGVSFAMPSPAGLPYRLRVRGVGTSGAIGAPSDAVPILTTVPSGLSVAYDGTTLSAAWDEIGDPRVDGYWVTVTGAGVSDPERVPGNTWSLALARPSGAVTVAVALASGPASGPVGPALNALTTVPVLTSVKFDGSVVTAAWNAATGAQNYVVRLLSSGQEVARGITNQTSITLAAPEPGATLQVAVAGLAGASSGPATRPIGLAASGPAITAAVTDPATGAVAISWPAISDATSYATQFYLRGEPKGAAVAGASPVALPADLQGLAGVQAAVSIGAADGSVELTGPNGPRFDIPAGRPQGLSISYDGTTLSASWEAAASASGYQLSVLDGPTTVKSSPPVRGNGTNMDFTPPDPAKSYTAVVQTLEAGSSGPPSDPQPLFTDGWYLATGPVQPPAPPSLPPRLFRPTSLAIAPAAMTLCLPQMAGTAGLTNLPIQPRPDRPSPPAAPLMLALASPANATFPYTLTIAEGALEYDTQSRADLRFCYGEMLKQAEIGGAVGRGIFTLQQAISRAIPQTFDDSLFFAFGMDGSARYADLRPGMVLRVAYTSYAPMAGDNAPAFSDGYSGAAAIDYPIDDYYSMTGEWRIGPDPFVAWLASHWIMQVPAPTSSSDAPLTLSGAADAADLYFAGFQRPFLRLFFPEQLQSALPPASSQIARQFAIAAADKWSDLPTSLDTIGSQFSVAYFGGRSVLRPCLRVTLDGVGHVVPVGTSVGNLLDSLARRPPGTNVGLRGMLLERAPGPVVMDAAAAFDAGAAVPVRFDYGPLGNLPGQPDIFSLPLLPGDVITLGPAA